MLCLNGKRLIVKDGTMHSIDLQNADVGSLYHQINSVKKPEFIPDLIEGLERTIKGQKMAYFDTYGAVTDVEQFRCQVRLFLSRKYQNIACSS